jgi:hypothetical protein
MNHKEVGRKDWDLSGSGQDAERVVVKTVVPYPAANFVFVLVAFSFSRCSLLHGWIGFILGLSGSKLDSATR